MMIHPKTGFSTGCYLYEKGYRTWVGEQTFLSSGGVSYKVWNNILNTEHESVDPKTLTDTALYNLVNNNITKRMVFGTKKISKDKYKERWVLSNGKKLVGWHAYVVIKIVDKGAGTDDDEVILYNPWGDGHLDDQQPDENKNATPFVGIPFKDIKKYVSGIHKPK